MNTQKLKKAIQKETSQNLQKFSSSYKQIVQEILRQPQIDNPEGLAKYYDYETDKLLEMTPVKKDFCLKLIEEINSAYKTCKQDQQKQTLQILKENILGKIFYLAIQEKKYLVIKNLTSHELKNKILTELDIILSSEDKAILYLDMLEHGAYRNFINGIISYLY